MQYYPESLKVWKFCIFLITKGNVPKTFIRNNLEYDEVLYEEVFYRSFHKKIDPFL